MKKFQENGSKPKWKIDGINRLPAQETKVIDLLTAFSNLSVEKSYDMSVANAQNFLLDHPNIKIDVTDAFQSFQIRVGATKVEDNIAYLSISDHPYIYKVKFHEFPLRNLIPQKFVESKPFKFDITKINHVVLKKGHYERTTLNIKKHQDLWLDSKNKSVPQDAIYKLVKKIENIKVKAIVDSYKDSDINDISKYLSKVMYQMNLKSADNSIDIKVYKIKKDIPSIKIRSKGYYLLTSSDRQAPLIITKNSLENFKVKE